MMLFKINVRDIKNVATHILKLMKRICIEHSAERLHTAHYLYLRATASVVELHPHRNPMMNESIFVLQMRKQGFREMKQLDQVHRAREPAGRHLNLPLRYNNP